jgi:hypothetical protein
MVRAGYVIRQSKGHPERAAPPSSTSAGRGRRVEVARGRVPPLHRGLGGARRGRGGVGLSDGAPVVQRTAPTLRQVIQPRRAALGPDGPLSLTGNPKHVIRGGGEAVWEFATGLQWFNAPPLR